MQKHNSHPLSVTAQMSTTYSTPNTTFPNIADGGGAARGGECPKLQIGSQQSITQCVGAPTSNIRFWGLVTISVTPHTVRTSSHHASWGGGDIVTAAAAELDLRWIRIRMG